MTKQQQLQIVSLKKQVNKSRNGLTRTSKSRERLAPIPRPITSDPDTLKYYLALTDPFHPNAVGARVPDMFAANTATYTIRATHTVTANSGGAASVFIFPNLVAALYAPQGNASDFSTLTWGDGTTTSSARWGVDDSALGAKLDNYRIVGMGVRIANMSSMTNSQGKFIVGSYPIDSTWHTKDFSVGGTTLATNAAYTIAATVGDWGVPLTSGGSIAPNLLVQYPGAVVKSALELGEQSLDVVSRPVDPRAFEFRTSNSQYNGWSTPGAAAGAATITGGSEFLQMAGFEALFVSLQGAVASTSTFDLEIVYHVEGRPYLAGVSAVTAQNTLVTPSASNASPVNPIGFMEAVSSAVKIPAVRKVLTTGANMIHPILGKFVDLVL